MTNLNDIIKDLAETLPCTCCKGTGIRKGLEGFGLESSLGQDRPCYSCQGIGKFNKPDLELIYKALQGRKGIRTVKPKDNKRAAYVWRLYRFHGGIDVTMPVMATLDVRGDPYEKLLDDMASALARRFIGTDMAAAYRWGTALGYLPQDAAPSGLPLTAYPLGPNKTN